MSFFEKIGDDSGRLQNSFSYIVRAILLVAIAYAIYFHLWRILFVNLLLLTLVLIPWIIRKQYAVNLPREIEFGIFAFVIASFFLGDIRGLIIQVFFGLAVGFVGFAIMLILYARSKMKRNYLLISIFSISFSVALGLGAEMAKFYLKLFFGYQFGIADYNYAIGSLTLVLLGAILSTVIGYVYMRVYRFTLMKDLVSDFKKKNPNFFKEKAESPEEILKLIEDGESKKHEFKSTLRTNLHTNEIDKRIESAVLKSVAALLNSEGGVLLVGVSDEGEVIGIEKDRFESNDKFALHFSNLLKQKIGNEYMPFISFEIVSVKDKNILKVECDKSNKPVFFKTEKDEEFYIRVGPASVQITGSKLLEYIKHNF